MIEKIGFTHLFVSDVLLYVVTSIGMIAGAMLFAVVVKKGLVIAGGIVKRVVSKIA